jgi:hypothetical protein
MLAPRKILSLRLALHPTGYIDRNKALLNPLRGVALI